MTEQLISLETAKLARGKGFSVKTTHYWSDYNDYEFRQSLYGTDPEYSGSGSSLIYAPTQSLLQKWLREKFGIDVLVNKAGTTIKPRKGYIVELYKPKMKLINWVTGVHKTYEEALEVGLQNGLNLI